MFVIGYLLVAVAKLISMILSIIYFLLVVRIIMSWVNPDPYNDIVRMIYKITDPILDPLRRMIPMKMGMFDFSPIVAFLLIYFLNQFLVNVLIAMGEKLL
jgi:YggT family protein